MDEIKSAAREEFSGVATLFKQAALSGTYLYPIRGVFYFLYHRNLWAPLTSRLAPLLLLSTGVVFAMLLFAYVPQSFLLTFVNGPIAWITTVALVLSESAAIITALSRTFLIDEALLDLFDAVLLQEGFDVLVENGRELSEGSSVLGRLGKTLKKPFKKFTIKNLVSYLIWLPINIIPIIGTMAFIVVQGRRLAPAYHSRYFQLKNYNENQKKRFLAMNKPAYIAFGVVSMLLQLVPIVSIFFAYTNTVGAALWAIDIEKGRGPIGRSRPGGVVLDGGKKES